MKPSITKDTSHSGEFIEINNELRPSPAIPTKDSTYPPKKSDPITKVSWNTMYMISPNIGRPNSLLVSTLSILSVVVTISFSGRLTLALTILFM